MFAKQWPYAHVRPKVPYYIEMSQTLQVASRRRSSAPRRPQQALDEAVAAAVELARQQ